MSVDITIASENFNAIFILFEDLLSLVLYNPNSTFVERL